MVEECHHDWWQSHPWVIGNQQQLVAIQQLEQVLGSLNQLMEWPFLDHDLKMKIIIKFSQSFFKKVFSKKLFWKVGSKKWFQKVTKYLPSRRQRNSWSGRSDSQCGPFIVVCLSSSNVLNISFRIICLEFFFENFLNFFRFFRNFFRVFFVTNLVGLILEVVSLIPGYTTTFPLLSLILLVWVMSTDSVGTADGLFDPAWTATGTGHETGTGFSTELFESSNGL